MTRLLLFGLAAVLSLWAGFIWFGEGTLHYVVIYLCYPSIFATFALFLWAVVDLHRQEFSLGQLVPKQRSAYLAIALVSGLLILFEPAEFKVVFDEVILSVSAQFLHFNRLAGVPREANDYLGSYMLMDAVLDKRPFFFPFILSLVHDFTGFRYQNAFYLNGALTILLVSLIYVLGKLLSCHRGGLLAVLLAGTLPLLSVFATSGHFEILNLVMLCLVVLFSYLYILEPDDRRLIALIYSLILLSQVRYENSLYLLPFGILILLGWKKAKRIILPVRAIICPFFLILYTMQLRMIHSSDHGFFQEGPNGRLDTFSLSYASENILSAIRFFFSVGQGQPNSYLLSTLGFSSLAAFLYYGLRRSRLMTGGDPKGTTMVFLVMAMALFSLVIAFFNFGMFDRYITNRLSLPIHLLFVLLTPFVLRRLNRNFIVWALLSGTVIAALTFSQFDRHAILTNGSQFSLLLAAFIAYMGWLWKKAPDPHTGILALPVVFILTVTMPVSHAHRYSTNYISNDIIMAEIDFIQSRPKNEKILWVSGNQYSGMLTRTNTTFIDVLKAHPQVAKEHIKRRMYGAIYVSSRIERDEEGIFSPAIESEWLDPAIFELEQVFEKQLSTKVIMEIHRLVDVTLPPQTLQESGQPKPDSQGAQDKTM